MSNHSLALPGAWWWVAAWSIVGLAARAIGLGRAPFWLDEYATYMFATQPLSRLLGPDIRSETNPPFYYLLQKAWLVFGESYAAMRSLPVILGVIAVPLAFVLGRRLVGSRAGMVAAAMLATNPLHIEYSRSIRCYPLLVASATAALTCLAYLLPDASMSGETAASHPRRRLWIWAGYVLSTLSALYAHNTGVLLPTLACLLVAWMWASGHVGGRFLAAWAAANLLVVLGYAPWLPSLLYQAQTTLKDFWIPPSTPDWSKSQLLGTYPYAKWTKPLIYALALPGLWALRRRRVVLAFILVMVVGQPLITYLISLNRPIFIVRAMIWPTVFFFVLVGSGLGTIRSLRTFAAGVVALGTIGLLSARAVYYPKATHSSVAALLAPLAAMDPNVDLLAFAPITMEWEYRYEAHLGGNRIHGTGVFFADRSPQLQNWFDSRFVTREALADEARRYRRVWLLREMTSPLPLSPGQGFEKLLSSLEAISSGTERWESGRIELVRYDVRQ